MNRPTLRHLLPVLLLPILTAATAQEGPTLVVSPTEVHVEATVTITGAGFDACVTPPDPDGGTATATDLRLNSAPPGIEVPDVKLGTVDESKGTFSGKVEVPRNALRTTYKITASCKSRSGNDIKQEVALAVVDEPALVVDDPVDPEPGADVSPLDDQVIPRPGIDLPDNPNPSITTVAVIATAALVAILALLLGRSALRRHTTANTSPTVHVRAVPGVVVGPTTQRPAPGGEGVRVVPHADPGTRVLRVG